MVCVSIYDIRSCISNSVSFARLKTKEEIAKIIHHITHNTIIIPVSKPDLRVTRIKRTETGRIITPEVVASIVRKADMSKCYTSAPQQIKWRLWNMIVEYIYPEIKRYALHVFAPGNIIYKVRESIEYNEYVEQTIKVINSLPEPISGMWKDGKIMITFPEEKRHNIRIVLDTTMSWWLLKIDNEDLIKGRNIEQLLQEMKKKL